NLIEGSSGAVLTGCVDHASANQTISKAERIVEHIDEHHIRQVMRDASRVDVSSRRHAPTPPQAVPIVVQLDHPRRAQLRAKAVYRLDRSCGLPHLSSLGLSRDQR